MKNKLRELKEYFEKCDRILMVFVFGSRAKGLARKVSDWDIGVYFKPKEYLELETEENYPNENKIWSDLIDILGTDEVDFTLLNRARPSLVYNVLRSGIPLVVKDKRLYFDLLCRVSYEAIDWWSFVGDFWRIREQSKSLSPEALSEIKERLIFLEEQFKDIERFENLTTDYYRDDRNERRNVERWTENLVMASLDIAKIILASAKKEIPQSYKDILKTFFVLYISSDKSIAERFSDFAKLRNILAHEYLDIKWKRIQNFIKEAKKIYPNFIKATKKIIRE